MAVFVACVTWPINPLPPTSGGYDISWITALAVAAHRGLHFGSQINYTYGPLGYLTNGNIFYDRTGIPADVVGGALYIGVLAVIARPAVRSLGVVLGGLLVLLLAELAAQLLATSGDLIGALMVALGILALRHEGRQLRTGHVVGISALAAFSALGKLSAAPVGLAVVVVLAVVAATSPGLTRGERLRGAGIVLGSYVGALVLLWLLAGQSLFDLPSYLRNAYDIISGYDDAQAVSSSSIHYLYKWVAVTAVVLLGAAIWRDRAQPRLQRAAIFVLWVMFMYVAFRHGFVREDISHVLQFFGLTAILAVAVLLGRRPNRAYVLACLVPVVLLWHIESWGIVNTFSFSTAGFVSDVNMVLGPNLRHRTESEAAAAMAASYGFPPALVARMSGQTVHFDPWEAAIAWAFPQIRWDPAPVFQSYNAYTSHLDDLNASFLAGPRAPRYVLRQNIAQDNQDPRFDSPRYMLELMCRYRQVMLVPGWQLLERGPDLCLTPQPAGTATAKFDQRVPVPAPTADSIVVGSFSNFSLPFTDTLEKLLFRRHAWYFATNQAVYRFVAGHASNPHVLSFPSCMGWSPALIDPTPYRSIAIGHLPQLTTPGVTESDSTYQVTFQRIPFHCTGPSAATSAPTRRRSPRIRRSASRSPRVSRRGSGSGSHRG
ncbi:MAG TPA: hypothetical protein VG186_06785 [Solirubrobacteraceae bacterium]|nr:hypothetical protein [Solirubrobacteraceae bacterium]